MRWRPMSNVLPDATQPPYLLAESSRSGAEKRLRAQGFEVAHVDAAGFRSDRDAALSVGGVLGFPDFYRGGWDGFFDLLCTEFLERFLVVGVLNANEFAERDLRLFVNVSWNLRDATRTVETDSAQLEFLYWGSWQ
jgi:hypothetical protein